MNTIKGALSEVELAVIRRDLAETDGWFRFVRPGVATSHIAHVSESGRVYLPESPDFVTEQDFHLASAHGTFHQLVDKHYATDLLAHIDALAASACP